MDLHVIFLGAFASFALLQWWALPKAEAAWAANGNVEKLAKVGVVAALKSLRTVVQAATLVYGALLGGLWILDALSDPATATALRSKIDFLEQVKEPLTFFKESVLGNLVFWAALAGLAYLVYKRHRSDLVALVAARAESEIARLKGEMERGERADLPPSEEMEQIRRDIEQLRGYAAQVPSEEATRSAEITAALERRWIEADFARRMNLATEPPMQPSLARRLWPRMATLLTSRGFARDSGLLAKACSNTGTAIMCLSLVGIAGSSLDTILTARIVHAWDLVVAADQAEAKASWEKARREQERNDPGPSPDPQQVQVLTRAFVHAYLSSPAWQPTVETVRREHLLEAAAIREHIVRSHAAPPHMTAVTLGDPQDVMVTAARDSALEPGRPGKLEERLARRLQDDIAQPFTNVWENFRTKITSFADAYSEPAEPSHFVKAILGEILDPAFKAAQPDASNAAMKELEKVVSKGLKAAVERSIETQFDRFLTDLAGEKSLSDALSRVASTASDAAGLTPANALDVKVFSQQIDSVVDRMASTFASTHPAFNRLDPIPGNPNNIEEVGRLAKQINERELSLWDGRGREPSMDYLADYEDYFAGSKSSAEATPRAKLLDAAGHGLKPAQLADAAKRARDFNKLNVFNIVGGVLIGRPANEPRADLDGFTLRWASVPGDRIVFTLRDSSGRETRLGPFLPDIVYRALLFAADGRPLVVTILNTGLSGAQKVILHPVLVDTALGCEMIELDKFVFHYVDKKTRDLETAEMQRVKSYDALYVIASLRGSHALVKSEYKHNYEEKIRNHIKANTPKALEAALIDPLLFSDPKRSPLASAYHIYDENVLSVMKSCSPPHKNTLSEFGDCVETAAEVGTHSKEVAESWLRLPKPLELVSGVRDRPFRLDTELTFLQRSGSVADRPLDFLIQDTSPSGNPNVWSFETLAPTIEKGVIALRKNNQVAEFILSNAEDFTVMQRLFRLILDGEMRGNILPSEVAQLADELRSKVHDKVATPRWDAAQFTPRIKQAASQLAILHNKLAAAPLFTKPGDPLIKSAMDKLRTCARVIADSKNRVVSEAAWETNCSLAALSEPLKASCSDEHNEATCRLALAAAFSADVLSKIRLANLLAIPVNTSVERTQPVACRAPL